MQHFSRIAQIGRRVFTLVLFIIIVVHVVKHQSILININKYMQKAGEPEDDAGFLKHNYSQLNCSCYSCLDYSGYTFLG